MSVLLLSSGAVVAAPMLPGFTLGARPGPVGGRRMSTPKVTEVLRGPEPVEHDPFIDDLPRAIVPARTAAPLWASG